MSTEIRPIEQTLAYLLREAVDYGLIHWGPKGELEQNAKADMLRRIEAALAHLNQQVTRP